MVRRVLLLMDEYGVGDSPLWFRLSSEDIGFAHAEELGLSLALRNDLRAWTDEFEAIRETEYRFPSVELFDRHVVDAFDLAARVQLELGDETHVWCGNSGNLTVSSGDSSTLVLAAKGAGSTVERHTRRGHEVVSATQAGSRGATADAIRRWRRATVRAGSPFGLAGPRAEGLRAAAALQRHAGPSTHVVFFAGARSPRDYPADLRPR